MHCACRSGSLSRLVSRFARKIKQAASLSSRFIWDMTTPLKRVQPLLAFAAAHLDEELSLATLAGLAGFSPFHLHRVFSAAVGETPKEFTLRLRLQRAAAMLVTCSDSALNIALSCGFQSHEVFCRAFRKRFEISPTAYRARGFRDKAQAIEAAEYLALVESIGPCIRLFHIRNERKSLGTDMEYSITKKEIPPQPVLVVRRRVKPSEISSVLADVLGRVFLCAQRNGIALAGQPFTRYIEWGPGLWTIESGLPVTAPVTIHGAAFAGDEVQSDTLPGGFVATTTHTGPYEALIDAHAAVQQWIEAQGLSASGAPWESYTTDPADYPDPKDWKTEIFWPLA